ncbi:hypothetical protein NSQ26_05855 [Bacillus sp. FSL W7-1360]
MHPSEIIKCLEKQGGNVSLGTQGIELNNASKIDDSMKAMLKENKRRLTLFLKGEYTDKKAKVDYINDKLLDYMVKHVVTNTDAIDNFLRSDEEAVELIMQRALKLWNNGWRNYAEYPANYEDDTTDDLADQIYTRVMQHTQKKQEEMRAC